MDTFKSKPSATSIAVPPASRSDTRLANLSGTHVCVPASTFTPKTLEEIQLIVRAAGEAGRRVRVAGSLTACSDAAMSKDVVVSMSEYTGVHMIDCDKAIVMVQSGIRLGDLHQKLRSFDLGLHNCGETADQTLAGAISTGYHGEADPENSNCRLVCLPLTGLMMTPTTASRCC